MNPQDLTSDVVRQILRASEGIPSQVSQARVVDGRLLPATTGHAISHHLHSVSSVSLKTKFVSLDDMVEALWQVLHSPTGVETLRNLKTGQRVTIRCDVNRLFAFECDVPDAQGQAKIHRVRFSIAEQIRAGRANTSCVTVIEARERSSRQYLQIHTFFPAFTDAQLKRLLEIARMDH